MNTTTLNPARAVSTTRGRRVRSAALAVGLPCAVVLVALLAVSVGPAGVTMLDSAQILLEPLRGLFASIGIDLPEHTRAAQSLVLGIRLPRVVLALLVGAALAVAGAVMQSVFRNPLAEPGITGVSSGAAVAAVLCITTGIAALHPLLLPGMAFVGALLAVAFVQFVAGVRGGSGPTLLLVGIALNAFLGALVSALIANAPSADAAQQAMFWLNGDLTASNWGDVTLAAAPILIGVIALMFAIPELNLFLLGEEQAAATGVRTGATRQLLLAGAALVTASAVAVTGVISFVGLVIPHLVRLVFGPDHRVLMPVSMGVGAIFLVLADLIARNLFTPIVLQTGTVTAFIGAPVLLVLVLRGRRRAGMR